MVAGGAHVYEQAMPLATHQVLTWVHRTPEGDTFYPDFDREDWVETAREERDGYDWVWLQRA
jgi:dihydrofolate reductase